MIIETALRNAIANAIDDEINTGTGTATLVFETSADAEVATINLQNPAFGNAATGVITLAGVPLSDTSATGGTIEHASIYNRNGTKALELTVGTAATEIIISSTVIAAADQIDLTALTITVPSS